MNYEELLKQLDQNNLPKVVGIIMDGNGRWAKEQDKPRTFGHLQGIETLKEIIQASKKIGIKELDVFAFSTENWNRPEDEVNFLMKAFVDNLNKYVNKFIQDDIKVKIYGEKSNLSNEILKTINLVENKTFNCQSFTFGICFNYGAKDEIVHAFNSLMKKRVNTGNFDNNITKEELEEHLYQPQKVDFVIRTSGEYRLSNFLLWQIAYAELYFSDKYWPAFTKEDLVVAILDYQKRHRRYGGIK